jgi:hypothetical protein
MTFMAKMRCLLFGHTKWYPQNYDPDGYKLLNFDFYDHQNQVTMHLCSRCGQFYGSVRHVPGLRPPNSVPTDWPAREDVTRPN